MKTPHLRPLVLPLVLLLAACAARPEEPVHTTLFRPGDHGSKYYRIPALATTAEGTLLAVADRRNDSQGDLPNAIDLVVRRSTDNGRTWSDQIPIALHTAETGYGDAALVTDRTSGDILCIFASGCGLWASTAEHPLDVNVSRSRDDGRTWSAPERITPQIYGPGCDNPAADSLSGLFAASGRALQLADGTLLFAAAPTGRERNGRRCTTTSASPGTGAAPGGCFPPQPPTAATRPNSRSWPTAAGS